MSTHRCCPNVRPRIAAPAILIAMLVTGPAKSDHPQVTGLDRQKIVRVTTATQQQVDAVVGLTGDVWSHGYGVGTFDVRVPADVCRVREEPVLVRPARHMRRPSDSGPRVELTTVGRYLIDEVGAVVRDP